MFDQPKIMAPRLVGDGEREYGLEEYVELFTFHVNQLYCLVESNDDAEWQEVNDIRNKVEKLATRKFMKIWNEQNF